MSAKKILIVEDQLQLANMMKSYLERIGYSVPASVSRGDQAILAAGKYQPDLVLMDICIEGDMDGIEAARQIRSDSGIPSILLTGDDRHDTFDRSKRAEPLAYLLKPFTSLKLKATIETSLRNYRKSEERTQTARHIGEQNYRDLVENMSQGIFRIDRSGRFLFVNNYLAKIMGYASSFDLLESSDEVKSNFVTPRSYEDLLDSLKEWGQVRNFEFQAYKKNGEEIWLSQSTRIINDSENGESHYEGFVQDISKRKEIEDARHLLQERQTALLAAVPDIIMEVDNNKVYTWSNGNGFDFFGDDVIGKEASHYFIGDQDTYSAVLPIFKGAQDSVHVESWQRRKDGEKRLLSWRCQNIKDTAGNITGVLSTARDITRIRLEQNKLIKSEEYLNNILSCLGDPVFVKDRQHRFVYVNDATCALIKRKREEVIGNTQFDNLPTEQVARIIEQEGQVFETGEPMVTIDELRNNQGDQHVVMTNKTRLKDANGNYQLVGIMHDISAVKNAESERAQMEIQLRQAQKLEAIGQLAAGIAHEINTPSQFVSDNTSFVKSAYIDIAKILQQYDNLLQANRNQSLNMELVQQVEDVISESDLEYLMSEVPKAISESLDGLSRITSIVRAMKEFSHPGSSEKMLMDLNHAIENTLTVCRNEWKYVAELETDFDPSLPSVPCLPGEINQVILNLIINAAHAITEVKKIDENRQGIIQICTGEKDNWAEIRVTDNGSGIPKEYQDQIFNPFFTTKEVGKGTGQGLAISHAVISGKHNGTIEFETESGKGTTFIVRLPKQAEQVIQ